MAYVFELVTNATDLPLPGLLDLRQAVALVEAAGSGAVDFASGITTVQLDSVLDLTGNVHINGNVNGTQPTVAIDQLAEDASVLRVEATSNATLFGVKLEGGSAVGGNGAAGAAGANAGGHSQVAPGQSGYPGYAGTIGATGGSGAGGGIVNLGSLTLIDSLVTDNSAIGGVGGVGGAGGTGAKGSTGAKGLTAENGLDGNSGGTGGAGGEGGAGGTGGEAEGGGIYNAGALNLINTTISGNIVIGGLGGEGGHGGQGALGGNGGDGAALPEGRNIAYGNGGPGGNGGNGGDGGAGGTGGFATGGGLYNAGVVVLQDSSVGGNTAIAGAPGIPGYFGQGGSIYNPSNGKYGVYINIASYGGHGAGPDSSTGAPGNIGYPGTYGPPGSFGVANNADIAGYGVLLFENTADVVGVRGSKIKLPGLSIVGNGHISMRIAASEGELFVATQPGLSAPTLQIQGTASYLQNYLSNLEFENASVGIATIDITVTGSGPTAQTSLTVSTTACFLPHTRIATPDGETPVEALRPGDLVLTRAGVARPIMWMGQGRARAWQGRRGATPVIVRRGALGHNVPNCDLRITRGHALFIDDVLIPVEFLINHRTILWDDHIQDVMFYHIELADHDVLLANGAAAETYRDDGNLSVFDNARPASDQPDKPPCAPVLTGGPIVDAVWRRLLDRAGPRPWLPLTDDADLHLLVDGWPLRPVARSGDDWHFHLTGRPDVVRVLSRSGVPQELGFGRDARALGVALRRLAVGDGTTTRTFLANDPALDDADRADGLHGFEPDEAIRWTNGDAGLPGTLFDAVDGPVSLTLTLGGATRYVDEGIKGRAAGLGRRAA